MARLDWRPGARPATSWRSCSSRHALRRLAGLLVAAWLGCVPWAAGADEPTIASGGAQTFDQRVRPILEAKCFRCHGAQSQKSDLNLSTLSGFRNGGESGPILDPQKLTDSRLYEYVHERTMPPEGEGELSDEEIATICGWIEAGAKLPDETPETAQQVTQHDALSILLLRCAICHGRQRREGGLDVRSVAAIRQGGKSGPAIVPGKPDESLLMKKILAAEMPPLKKLASYSVKPVTNVEIETLSKWIAAGAPEMALAPDVASGEPDPLLSDADRQFWSFQAPRAEPAPTIEAADQIRNPIDAFVLSKLEERGLTLSPEGDRTTLIRRVYLDLLGLPPDPREIDAFVADDRGDAYERLVERALASPHYGERWGQYWLDLAGYSDSEGITNADDLRPHAWRYRDYVIRAFNADKPYDRFLLEQLAGDELADYESAPEITSEIYDNLVATAFLRLAPDGTYSPITSFVPDRLEVIDDEIEVFSSAVLGLTIKCARCHSHKFDPIPQRDYYRLAAVFKGALDEHDWLAPRTGGPSQPADALTCLAPYVTSAERAAWQAAGSKPQDEPKIRAVIDHGEPSPTYILRRGNYLTRSSLVGPGVPSALTDGHTPLVIEPPWPGAKKTGRRLALARWVTQKDNPLTARVMVNRVWKHHFGEGIVRSLDNFGKMGAPPTHPELLDHLAVYFAEHGWSVKGLHRLMMTSSTYRQTSEVSEDRRRLDPERALLSRMPLKRMEAEVLHDAMLFVSGRLNSTPFGPADALEVRDDGLVTARAGIDRRWRRSMYVLKRRTQPLTILQGFDVASMDPNCIERRESIVAPQALHLANNALVRELAGALADRVWNEVGDDKAAQVRTAYRIVAGRDPTTDEDRVAQKSLGELESTWARHHRGTRHELAATARYWIRESAPDAVYQNDLVSVWSSAESDKGRRIGVLEFDVSTLANLRLTDAHLELGVLSQTPLAQSAAVIPSGVSDITWNSFVKEKQALARPLAALGKVKLPTSGRNTPIGAYLRTSPAAADDLQLIKSAVENGGKLAIILTADEDGTAYRQDWDDGVHASSRANPPRLVVLDDRPDQLAVRRRALENLCHALFNSAAFLYID